MFDADQLQRLYRFGVSMSGDETLAYDLLQDALEAYLRIYRRAPPDHPMAYVRTSMRNGYIDRLRREQRYPEQDFDEQQEGMVDLSCAMLEDIIIAQEELDRLWSRLSSMERMVLYLWAVEGFTAKEIAAQLDAPRGTILARLHRLRRKLTQPVQARTLPQSGGAA